MKFVQSSRMRAGLLATITLVGGATLAGCHNPYGPPGDTGGQRDPYRRGWVEPCDEPVSYASISIYSSSTSYGHYDDDCGPKYCPPPVAYCPPPVVYCPPPAPYCPPGKSYGSWHGGRSGGGHGGSGWGGDRGDRGDRGGSRQQAAAPAPKSYSPPPPPKNYAPPAPKQVAAIPAGRGFGKPEPSNGSKGNGGGEHKSGGFRNGLDRSR